MTAKIRTVKRRPDMRKAVFLFPSGLTLLNLFFGVFAIIAASRLEFTTAGVYVVIGGICDALDGRVARATNAGSQFGEELDSLVDAITFGLAPGMIMYYAVLNRGGWDWVWVFAFAAAAVLRLARFNIEQAGTAKTYFQGLPSPAAGITLASYYWFSESWLYSYGRIANLNWHVALRFLMAVLAALMISNVPYPTFPRTGFRSVRALGSTIIVFGAFALLLTGKLEYFFPLAVAYVAFGLVRWLLSGLFERRQPTLPYDLSEGEDDEEEEDEELELVDARQYSRGGHRDESGTRQERLRGRAARTDAIDPGVSRPDRGPRKPERGERTAAAERAPEADRAARRDKKKERPKRPDRTDRPERPARPARPDVAAAPSGVATPLAPATTAPAPVVTGVDAITLGAPEVTSLGERDEPDAIGDDGAEDETSMETGAPGTEGGAPTRKRKRRRRRGERKDRGPSTAAESVGEQSAGAPPAAAVGRKASASSDHDQSPYASPVRPTAPAAPTGNAGEPAAPPPLPSSPSTPSTSSEFPE